MEDRELTSEGRLLAGALVAFALIALLAAWDLASDLREGTTFSHVTIEAAVFLVGFIGAIVRARRLPQDRRSAQEMRREARDLAERLAASAAEAARWRGEARDLLRGLGPHRVTPLVEAGAALEQQFERWSRNSRRRAARGPAANT